MQVYDHDEFNRTNGALGKSAAGRTWTTYGPSALVVLSNVARGVSNSEADLAVVDTKVSDGYVYLEVPTLVTAADAGAGIGISFRTTDVNNYWNIMAFTAGSSNVALYLQKVVAGAITTITNYNPGTSMSAGMVLGASFVGNKIAAWVNKAGANGPPTNPWSTTTDSFNQTATKHGLFSYYSTTGRVDNWRFLAGDGRPGVGMPVPARRFR